MKPTQIIIHCSDTPTGRDTPASEIHQWHVSQDWSGIGYHWVIGIHGKLEAGRPEYWQGSHCKGQNGNSIGICLVGRGEYSDIQKIKLGILIGEIKSRHRIESIKLHCDYDSRKTCPMATLEQLGLE